MKRSLIWVLSIVLISTFLWACSVEMEESFITGTAVKGLVVNADVSVYVYKQGGRGELLATATTDQNGGFTVTVKYTGVVEIVITGGKYDDEATGEEVSLGSFELRNILIADGKMNIGVTALTTIAAGYVDANAEYGLATAISNASREVSEAFGLSGIDINSVIPVDLSNPADGAATDKQKDYGSVLAGLSELIKMNGLDPEDLLVLIEAMVEDFSDGVFDGKRNGEALDFVLTITPEGALEGLQTAIKNFIDGPRNNVPDYIPGGRP